MVQQTIGSQTVMAVSSALDLRTNAGGSLVSSNIMYGYQDAYTREFYEFGHVTSGAPMRVVTNTPLPAVLPGTWSPTTAIAVTVFYSDSSYCIDTLSVAGTEVVRVPAGAFTTWRATETSSDSKYGASNSTCWYAPQLGAAVRESISYAYSDGSRLDLTTDLVATNIPLG